MRTHPHAVVPLSTATPMASCKARSALNKCVETTPSPPPPPTPPPTPSSSPSPVWQMRKWLLRGYLVPTLPVRRMPNHAMVKEGGGKDVYVRASYCVDSISRTLALARGRMLGRTPALATHCPGIAGGHSCLAIEIHRAGPPPALTLTITTITITNTITTTIATFALCTPFRCGCFQTRNSPSRARQWRCVLTTNPLTCSPVSRV